MKMVKPKWRKPGQGFYLCMAGLFFITVVLYFSLLIPFFILAYAATFMLLIWRGVTRIFSLGRSY